MLRLVLSTDWVAVRDELLRRVADDVKQEKPGIVLMVPELISHDMERRLCAVAGDTSSRFAEVLSFPRLARRVAETLGRAPEACMDAGGRIVAMAAAARSLHSQLKVYAAVETKPEFLTGLVDAVDEFKRCCISSQDLFAAAKQSSGSFAQKLEELSLLLSAYEGLCAQGKHDPRDRMTVLLEQLADGEYGEKHTFYIDGFPDFTRQHFAILEYLIRVSPCVTVGLNCDSVSSGLMAFEKAGDTAAQFIRCAKNAGVEVEIQVIPGIDTPMKPVCAGLFQGKIQPVTQGLTLYRAESAFQEVQAAARRIRELVHGGCRYRDISVVCTDMSVYQHLIRLQFRRSQIPLYTSGTEDVLQKNGISTVIAALDAALGGFEQRDVFRYLRSALSPVSQQMADKLENYAIVWGIRGNRWLTEWVNNPSGLDQIRTEQEHRDLDELNAARRQLIEPLKRLRDGFRDGRNLANQVNALYDYLNEVGFADSLQRLARDMDDAGDNPGAQILNQLWEILLTALEQMKDTLGQTAWDSESFVKLFSLLLSQYDVGTIPPVLDAVTVGPVSAMRCQQAKHLILLGAEEGKLPGYAGSAGILNDQERTALRNMGITLTGGAMEGIQAEFAEVYGVFCGARETVFVSCAGGQPSYVYKRLLQMTGKELSGDLGAAADPVDAAACLVALGDEAAAKHLQLEETYQLVKKQANYHLGNIEPENVRKLYGDTLRLSASQVDRQAECRLSYFLKYGLRAEERKEVTVDPAEFGTYVHAVLEHTAREVMTRGGFAHVSLDETMEIALKFSDEYAKTRFQQLDSQRLHYLFLRNRRELELVVAELWEELGQSRFLPKAFELGFGDDGEMPAISVTATKMQAVLRGFVDRVDIWQDGEKRYFRVVDYKTGRKDFDYCDVFNGVGLQMLLYLFVLEQGGEELFSEQLQGAGIQYFPARAPVMTADARLSDDAAQQERRKQWKRKGLLLADESVLHAMDPQESGRLCCSRKKDGTISGDLATREQIEMLKKHVFRVLSNMVDDIASGNIVPNPYTRGTAHDACTYCPYGSVCHPNLVEGRRNYKAMTAQRFWEEVEKEDRHG